MAIYGGIVGLSLYALYKEGEQLGCTSDLMCDCDNANGKVVKGSAPAQDDTVDQLLNKIDYASEASSRDVVWRRSWLSGVILITIAWLVIYYKIPDQQEMLAGAIIIAAGLYFLYNFYKFHMYDHITKNIKASTKMLRSMINREEQLPDSNPDRDDTKDDATTLSFPASKLPVMETKDTPIP